MAFNYKVTDMLIFAIFAFQILNRKIQNENLFSLFLEVLVFPKSSQKTHSTLELAKLSSKSESNWLKPQWNVFLLWASETFSGISRNRMEMQLSLERGKKSNTFITVLALERWLEYFVTFLLGQKVKIFRIQKSHVNTPPF